MSTLIPEKKHRLVLKTCIDVPEESPSFPMALQHVGISGKTVWVSLSENNRGRIPFNARILVDLPENRRGIHMSRIEQVISALHDMEFTSLPEYGRQLASQVLEVQHARAARVELAGRMPMIQQAAVSGLRSVDSIDVNFSIILKKTNGAMSEKASAGVGVCHLTACPCTLTYNKALFNRFDDPWPQATHSQRSKTELQVAPPDYAALPGYNDLLDVLNEVLHISQDLLKRPDETELVLKAHGNPQFVEDTVREVARAFGDKFKDVLPGSTEITIRTLSLESIHNHDVECCLDTTIADILAASGQSRKEQNPNE